METTIFQLKKEVEEILTTNILPYWMDKMTDVQHGGFYGRINGQEVLMPEAEKGAILNARILWTFSSAIVCCTSQNTWKPPPVQTRNHRPVLRQGVWRNLLEHQCRRPSARHQEANLCHRVCHLRAQRIPSCHGRQRSIGICHPSVSRHRGAQLRPKEKRILRSADPRMGRNGRHAPQRQGCQRAKDHEYPSAHPGAVHQSVQGMEGRLPEASAAQPRPLVHRPHTGHGDIASATLLQ